MLPGQHNVHGETNRITAGGAHSAVTPSSCRATTPVWSRPHVAAICSGKPRSNAASTTPAPQDPACAPSGSAQTSRSNHPVRGPRTAADRRRFVAATARVDRRGWRRSRPARVRPGPRRFDALIVRHEIADHGRGSGTDEQFDDASRSCQVRGPTLQLDFAEPTQAVRVEYQHDVPRELEDDGLVSLVDNDARRSAGSSKLTAMLCVAVPD